MKFLDNPSLLSRRGLLGRMGAGAVAATAGVPLLSGAPARAVDAPPLAQAPRRRVMRAAHLTDIHVQPERSADQGFIACLHHVQSQPDKPDLIITGGDSIMDAMKKDFDRTKLQWDLWHRILKDECSLPVFSAVGNHDIWGWHKGKSKTTGSEPLWGKRWAAEALKIDRTYYSIDRGGWHLVFLDSVAPDEGNNPPYKARLDDEQYEWLRGDLASVDAKTPVMLVSHIPIFSVAALMGKKVDETGAVRLPTGAMHTDYRRIHELLHRHRNVKLAVSGHLHLVERIEFDGVTYLCNGAVSGNWWKGRHLDQCDPGYALIDLYDDGAVESRYVTYGWVARPDAKPEPAPAAAAKA